MGQKRKRPIKNGEQTSSPSAGGFSPKQAPAYDEKTQHPHPVISLYYHQTLTLRQYLLQQLPSSSKSRRRRIASLKAPGDEQARAYAQYGPTAQSLVDLLDTTLIGVPTGPSSGSRASRQRDFTAFTQSQERSQCTDTGPHCPQTEVLSLSA